MRKFTTMSSAADPGALPVPTNVSRGVSISRSTRKQHQSDHPRHRLRAAQRSGPHEFSADFYLLKPKDIGAGNRTVLLDVKIRGRKRILRYFNATAATNDPRTEADFGDGFLMHHGFMLLDVG